MIQDHHQLIAILLYKYLVWRKVALLPSGYHINYLYLVGETFQLANLTECADALPDFIIYCSLVTAVRFQYKHIQAYNHVQLLSVACHCKTRNITESEPAF